MTSKVLTREAFFAACPKARIDEADIECVGKVRIAQLTAGSMEKISKDSTGPFETTIRTVQASILDDAGHPIFNSREEVAALPSHIFGRLSEAVNRVNGFDAEKIAKNSAPAQSAGSVTV